jgi:hypothetical protein
MSKEEKISFQIILSEPVSKFHADFCHFSGANRFFWGMKGKHWTPNKNN